MPSLTFLMSFCQDFDTVRIGVRSSDPNTNIVLNQNDIFMRNN